MKNSISIIILCFWSGFLFPQSPANPTLHAQFIFEKGKYFAQCHASSIEETKDGTLLATWFAGTHEGNQDVKIWGSTFDGQKWSEPQVWADGTAEKTYPCWNPVLFRKKDQETIYLFYKVGPNPREWWGMVKTSNDNGKTWTKAERLPDGILGPIKNKPKELADGTVISPSSDELSETRWLAHVEISNDNMKTWNKYPIDHASTFNVIQPSIVIHPNQEIQVLCRSREGAVISSFSKNQGKTWSNLEKTSLINPNSGTDAIPVGDQFWIVYNPDIPGKEWWEGRTKLYVANSSDGLQWKQFLTLEDKDKGEFSYPTIFQDSKGLVHITYTYDRVQIKHIIIDPKS